MTPVVLFRSLEASGRIAVLAAKQAAIVHPDITAQDASAGSPLARIFCCGDLPAKSLLDQLVVDASSRTDAVRGEVDFLGATRDVHLVLCGRRNQMPHHRSASPTSDA